MSTKHIVRAPGTDRYLIEIPDAIPGPAGATGPAGPTGATGPTGPAGADFTPVYVTGIAEMTGELAVGDGVPAIIEFTAYSELENASYDSGDQTYISPDLTGLFMLTVEAHWYGSPAPRASMREVKVYDSSGAADITFASQSASSAYDSGATLVRLTSGTKLQVIVSHTDSSASGGVDYVKLALVRVAP